MTLTFGIYRSSFNLMSKATIESEKCTVSPFSHTKAYLTKFNLAIKKVKVNQGSSFE